MRNRMRQDAPRGRDWARAVVMSTVAALLGMSACGSKSGDTSGGQAGDTAPNTCGDLASCRDAATLPTTTPDAGGATDSGKPMPLPTGHPAPDSMACAPTGPTASELGSKREVLYSGERRLAQVSTKHDHPLVADASQGILRYVGGAAMFERIVVSGVPTFLEADLSVYFGVGGKILKAPLEGTDATADVVADGQLGLLSFLTYDQDNLYFSSPNYQQLLQQPLLGAAPRTLATAVDAADMKLLGGYLYYSDSNTQQVYRVKVDPTKDEERVPQPLTDGKNTVVQAIAVGDDTLYFVDDTQIFSTPVDGSARRTSVGQAGPGTLGRGRITSMKLMDDRLFWQDDVGSIGWTAIDGSECGLILRGEGAVPHGWDVDAKAVYLTQVSATTSLFWRIAR